MRGGGGACTHGEATYKGDRTNTLKYCNFQGQKDKGRRTNGFLGFICEEVQQSGQRSA